MVEVEERSLYRSRDIYGDVGYRFWRWADWAEWRLDEPAEDEKNEAESCVMYRIAQLPD